MKHLEILVYEGRQIQESNNTDSFSHLKKIFNKAGFKVRINERLTRLDATSDYISIVIQERR